jgi:hypothetical protein
MTIEDQLNALKKDYPMKVLQWIRENCYVPYAYLDSADDYTIEWN